MTVPDQLRELLATAMLTDGFIQPPMRWRQESWARRFDRSSDEGPSHNFQAAITALADSAEARRDDGYRQIGRDSVVALCAPSTLRPTGGAMDEGAVVKAFLASMIWGYGLIGYGPYRTERVLARRSATCDETTIGQLVEVAEVAQSYGGVKAFGHVAEQRREGKPYLKYLGPAFGTKFLYFLTKAADGQMPSPVLDSVVRGWLQRNAPDAGSFVLAWWDAPSYERYVNLLQSWAAELSHDLDLPLHADDLELLMFRDSRGELSQSSESEDVTAESMLDDLSAEADARAGTNDDVGLLLVDALRAWFALHPDRGQ